MRTALLALSLAGCAPVATIPDGGWELVEVRRPGVDPVPSDGSVLLRTAFPDVTVGASTTTAEVLPREAWPEDCPTQWAASRLEAWRLADPVEPTPGDVLAEPTLIAACDGTDGPAAQVWLLEGAPAHHQPCATTTCWVYQLLLE